MGSKLFRRLLIAVGALFLPFHAGHTSEESCLDPFTPVGRKYEVPPGLLYAIAKVESAENPMAMNIAGKKQDTRTPSEVAVAARKAIGEGKSFDICLMQINVQWFKGEDPLDMLRLDTCVDKAGWLVARLLKDHNDDIYEAIKRYHSPDRRRGEAYASKVIREWKNLKGSFCVDYLYGAAPFLSSHAGDSAAAD